MFEHLDAEKTMKNLFKILSLFVAYCFISTNIIAHTETDQLITKQPTIKGALAYDPDSACTTYCGGLATCCFEFNTHDDGKRKEVIFSSFYAEMVASSHNMNKTLPLKTAKCGWAIRERLEPACAAVPDCCSRRNGVWCSVLGCDEVPDEYDHALELVWHYYSSPLYSWKRSCQCCAGLGLAADIIAAAQGGLHGHVSAAVALPSILGLPLAVMALSCLTPRLCPKVDYLCYSNSCVQCSGYAASCLPWAVLVGLAVV
jgi:hypothetical protein